MLVCTKVSIHSLLNLKQYHKAIEVLKKALDIDPHHLTAKIYLKKAKATHDQIYNELESARLGEFLLSGQTSESHFTHEQQSLDNLIDSVFRENNAEEGSSSKRKKKSKKKLKKKKEKRHKEHGSPSDIESP